MEAKERTPSSVLFFIYEYTHHQSYVLQRRFISWCPRPFEYVFDAVVFHVAVVFYVDVFVFHFVVLHVAVVFHVVVVHVVFHVVVVFRCRCFYVAGAYKTKS